MYALVGIMKRPDHWSREQFRKWWLTEHAEVAKQLPGLRSYKVYPPAHSFDAVSGELSAEPSHDGLAFLWFDDKKALEDAFASKEGEHDRVSFGKTGVSVIAFGVDDDIEMLANPSR